MCFPGKRLKDLFSDSTKPAAQSPPKQSPPAAPVAASSAQPATEPAAAQPQPAPSEPTAPATDTTATMSAPRIAIVIYTLYGHIGKSESRSIISRRTFVLMQCTKWLRPSRRVSKVPEAKPPSTSKCLTVHACLIDPQLNMVASQN